MTRVVLVCEDDEQIQGLLLRLIEREGYATEVATNGQEALRHIEEASFDAILLDLQMPVMTGLEVIEHLRQAHPELLPKVIVVTASAPAMRKPPEGIGGFFAKPFEIRAVAEAIHRVAEKSAS